MIAERRKEQNKKKNWHGIKSHFFFLNQVIKRGREAFVFFFVVVFAIN